MTALCCLSQQFSSQVIRGHSCASGTNKFSHSSGVFKGFYYVTAHCLQSDTTGLASAILADMPEINKNFLILIFEPCSQNIF